VAESSPSRSRQGRQRLAVSGRTRTPAGVVAALVSSAEPTK
jgi:hypothetical protein